MNGQAPDQVFMTKSSFRGQKVNKLKNGLVSSVVVAAQTDSALPHLAPTPGRAAAFIGK